MSEKIGKHDFEPYAGSGYCLTFSVGVFQWVPMKSCYGTKKGKAKVRVKGFTSDREAVHARAREIADQLDAGTYVGPKTVTVRSGT